MMQPQAKRKSEGASPAPKQRRTGASRKPRELFVPYSGDEDSNGIIDDDEQVKVKSTKKGKAGRKSEPVREPKAAEYQDDELRSQSQAMFDILQFGIKRKAKGAKDSTSYLAGFKQQVETEEQELKKRIQDHMDASLNQACDFAISFKNTFILTYEMRQSSRNDKYSQSAFRSIHSRSQKMQKNALQLIAQYEEVASQISAQDQIILHGQDWEKKEKHMDWILQKGMEYNQKRLESILSASKEPEMDGKTAKALALLHEEVETGATEQWGKAVKKQTKSWERFIRKNFLGGAC